MQKGYVFRAGSFWFLRYRDAFLVDGKIVRKQKCVKLAQYGDRYRRESDLADLVEEKLAGVRAASKCAKSCEPFSHYVSNTYLPFVLANMKPSTYAAYSTYWKRYIKPRVGKYALRDFTVAIVAGLLKDVARAHKLNKATVTKIRSVLSGIFSFAISEGDFPARSKADNPAPGARIPETASDPKPTHSAKREEVSAILAALKAQPKLKLEEMPLERAAVAIVAMLGTRPGEARGLKWEDWDRANQQISIERAVWHKHEGSPKTLQSVRFVAVSAELREILLAFWNEQKCPLGGYILKGPKGRPVILDNLAKRSIRDRLEKVNQENETDWSWPGWYSLRRFHGTAVRAKSNLETTSKALGNSKAVADRHYVKPLEVLPDVRKAVNDSMSGLVQ